LDGAFAVAADGLGRPLQELAKELRSVGGSGIGQHVEQRDCRDEQGQRRLEKAESHGSAEAAVV